MTVAAWACK